MELDFIVIGAEKGGTSLLVDVLRRSPAIAMPSREVRHFRNPFYPAKEAPHEYFSAADEGRKRGIKHPSYLGRRGVAERIKVHSPNAKLIAILRDPVDRTFASYLHYVRHGQIPCLHPDVGIPLMFAKPNAFPKYRDIIAFGQYAHYLESYLRCFSREQIMILEFEEFIADPAGMDALFSFMSLDRPDGVWPLKPSNAGVYDWERCQWEHRVAWARNTYDEFRNITGTWRVPIEVPPPPALSEPLSLSPKLRDLIGMHYASQGADLAALGLLKPRHWRV